MLKPRFPSCSNCTPSLSRSTVSWGFLPLMSEKKCVSDNKPSLCCTALFQQDCGSQMAATQPQTERHSVTPGPCIYLCSGQIRLLSTIKDTKAAPPKESQQILPHLPSSNTRTVELPSEIWLPANGWVTNLWRIMLMFQKDPQALW